MSHVHFKAEGDVEFRALLYVPDKAPPNFLGDYTSQGSKAACSSARTSRSSSRGAAPARPAPGRSPAAYERLCRASDRAATACPASRTLARPHASRQPRAEPFTAGSAGARARGAPGMPYPTLSWHAPTAVARRAGT